MATRPLPMSRTLLRLAIHGDDPYAAFIEKLNRPMGHPRFHEYQKLSYRNMMAQAKRLNP